MGNMSHIGFAQVFEQLVDLLFLVPKINSTRLIQNYHYPYAYLIYFWDTTVPWALSAWDTATSDLPHGVA